MSLIPVCLLPPVAWLSDQLILLFLQDYLQLTCDVDDGDGHFVERVMQDDWPALIRRFSGFQIERERSKKIYLHALGKLLPPTGSKQNAGLGSRYATTKSFTAAIRSSAGHGSKVG